MDGVLKELNSTVCIRHVCDKTYFLTVQSEHLRQPTHAESRFKNSKSFR